METVDLQQLIIADIDCYRGNTEYVTVYYNNGSQVMVNEPFEKVDEYIESNKRFV